MPKQLNTAVMILVATAAGIAMPATNAGAQQQGATSAPAASAAKPPTQSTSSAASAPKKPTVKTEGTLVLNTPKDKSSYAIGRNVGMNMKSDGVEINPDAFLQGVKDSMDGRKSLLTDDEEKTAMTALQNDLTQKLAERMKQVGIENKKEGDAYLAANKTKDGVVTLPSGLQYKILTAGTGPKPTTSDTVVCNYRGTLIDGTEFDSSYKRGQPASFPVAGVIKGWTEALQLMPTGSKWQLVLPSDLAYGAQGAGTQIGPNAVLVFEVELISIKGK